MLNWNWLFLSQRGIQGDFEYNCMFLWFCILKKFWIAICYLNKNCVTAWIPLLFPLWFRVLFSNSATAKGGQGAANLLSLVFLAPSPSPFDVECCIGIGCFPVKGGFRGILNSIVFYDFAFWKNFELLFAIWIKIVVTAWIPLLFPLWSEVPVSNRATAQRGTRSCEFAEFGFFGPVPVPLWRRMLNWNWLFPSQRGISNTIVYYWFYVLEKFWIAICYCLLYTSPSPRD